MDQMGFSNKQQKLVIAIIDEAIEWSVNNAYDALASTEPLFEDVVVPYEQILRAAQERIYDEVAEFTPPIMRGQQPKQRRDNEHQVLEHTDPQGK